MPKRIPSVILTLFLFVGMSTPAHAQDQNAKIDAELAAAQKWPGVIRSDIGVTRNETKIPCLITADDLDYNTSKTRILLVGGLDGWPPTGTAYGDPKSPEAIYLWRWIGTHAPDLVVVLESGSGVLPYFPSAGGKPPINPHASKPVGRVPREPDPSRSSQRA